MDKLLEMLGVKKLDEAKQTEIKTKLEQIIEVKAKEQVEPLFTEEKERLMEEYEDKFEEYKKEITSKFSNFVDSILEEEFVIPEKIVEFARRGELYSELIEQFKIRLAIDEGLLDDEVKALLKEAKDEIVTLREKMDEATAEKLELELDSQKLAAALYLREKCDGLTESQKAHVLTILGDTTDRDEIDKKFDIVVETAKISEQDDDDDDDDEDGKKKKKNKNKDKDNKDNKDNKDDKDKKADEGKGNIEDKDADNLNEDDSPFAQSVKEWKKILKENKF